jgi:hypothetical protein
LWEEVRQLDEQAVEIQSLARLAGKNSRINLIAPKLHQALAIERSTGCLVD